MDREVINEFVNGSEPAFGQVYDCYAGKVLRLGRQMFHTDEMAHDFVQDVFLRAWEKRDKFEGVESFDDYLYMLARNLALKHKKKMVSEQLKIEEYLLITGTQQGSAADQQVLEKELEHVISTAISTSSLRRQLIYKLSRENGLSQKEIAEKLGLAKQTVDNEMHSLLKTIRVHLKSHLASILLALSLWR